MLKQVLKFSQKIRPIKEQDQNPDSMMPNMNDGQRSSEAAATPRVSSGNQQLRFELPTFREEKRSQLEPGNKA